MCCQKNKLELVDLNSTKGREFAGNSMQCKSTVIRCMRSDTHKHSIKIFRERVDSLNAAILVCRSSQKRDAVHYLRSATRRMEAQLTLLEISEVLTPHLDEIIQVRKRLKEIRRAAGKVRDLDVQFELIDRHKWTGPTSHQVADGGQMRVAAQQVTGLPPLHSRRDGRHSDIFERNISSDGTTDGTTRLGLIAYPEIIRSDPMGEQAGKGIYGYAVDFRASSGLEAAKCRV